MFLHAISIVYLPATVKDTDQLKTQIPRFVAYLQQRDAVEDKKKLTPGMFYFG